MEANRGMKREVYEAERLALLDIIRDCRSGKVRADKAEMYINSARRTLAGIRAQRYARVGSRAFRNRDR